MLLFILGLTVLNAFFAGFHFMAGNYVVALFCSLATILCIAGTGIKTDT